MVVVKTLSELLSPEAYDDGDDKKERTEYIQGKMVRIGRASAHHNLISNNFSSSLWNVLRNQGYKIYQSEVRVTNEDRSSFVYPDIVLVKGTPQYIDREQDTISNPVLVVEILSEASAEIDRTAKFEIYQSIGAIQEYVLVHEHKIGVERYFRDGDEWLYTAKTDLSAKIALKSLQLSTPLTDIYEAVEFPSANTFGKK